MPFKTLVKIIPRYFLVWSLLGFGNISNGSILHISRQLVVFFSQKEHKSFIKKKFINSIEIYNLFNKKTKIRKKNKI